MATIARWRGLPWLVAGMALLLRLVRLNFQPLWWDEGWSLYFARADPGTMLGLTAVDIHPPFYYLLLHLWTGVLGSSPLAVRLLSVLIGVATGPLLYLTGSRLFGRGAGLAAAALLALSPLHIFYSQEVRMYALVALLGLAALWFALDLEAGRHKAGAWPGYVLAATAALYTQYYAGFLILALNLVVLVRWLRVRRPLRAAVPWLCAQVAIALLFLPWAWYAGAKLLTYIQFKVGVEADRPLGLLAYLGSHLAALTTGHSEGPLAPWWWLGLLPLAGLVLSMGAFFLPRRRRLGAARYAGIWPATIVAVTLLCGFVVNRLLPFNPPRGERLLLLALPAHLLLVAAGLSAAWRRCRPVAFGLGALLLVSGLVTLGYFYAVPRYPDDDYRPLAARLGALARPADAVLCVHPWQVGYLEAYLPDRVRPALVLTPREVVPRERQLWADDPVLMEADLDALLARHNRLWFADHRSMGRVLESQVESYLVQRAYPVLSEWFGENTVLSLFFAGEPAVRPVAARFGGWLALRGVALDSGPLEAGWGIAAVGLSWELSDWPEGEYAVGLRLVSSSGQVWAQRDAPPHGGLEPFGDWPLGGITADRHGLLVLAGTPPGEYQVVLRVYRASDLSVLPVEFDGGGGGEVALGTVQVVRPETSPPLAALGVPYRLDLRAGDRLRLLGYGEPRAVAVRPGEAIELDLYWQALADPGEDLLPRLQLLDGDRVVAELTEKPVGGSYPTAWWKAGQLVRDPHALLVPAPVPAGRYTVALSLIRAADGEPLPLDGARDPLALFEVDVIGREHNYQPPSPGRVQTAALGAQVELIGYDLEAKAFSPGSSVEVTLHWHALVTPDRAYDAFVHLLDSSGSIVAQHDGPPGQGELPALGWLPGEYLVDTHRLQLPPDLPEGDYRLGVGLYDPRTGGRPGDRIVLGDVVKVRAD